MNFDDNLILLTDSYKVSHWLQYPPGTERVYSYLESRGGRFADVVFFGLQYYLRKYLEGAVITREKVDAAEVFWAEHLGASGLLNRAGWDAIVSDHGGRLPVRIRAVPEGTVVPTRNVMMTIENTDPRLYWLPNYLETLLVQVWYGCTVATLSREMRKLIHGSLEETGDPSGLDFKLHDFGFRGASSVESAAMGGAAHLVNFRSTDTVAGALLAQQYYGADMPGFSIPASEHSTITSWGKENELAAFRNMLERYPTGLVACVSDSYDIFRACEQYWGRDLKERVLERDGTVVVRPDSGDPPSIVNRVLEILGLAFGSTTNDKGYRTLPPQVRVIQGDGIDYAMTERILTVLKLNGWSADNVTFGMGGGLLQKLDRDTQKFAFKCSEVVVKGEAQDVWKDPVTDPEKISKQGRLALQRNATGALETLPERNAHADELIEVFADGRLVSPTTFADVRERAARN